VFDQERFDELARGLASGRLTRWQVIKGLGAGVLLGSAGLLQPWSASFAEAQTRVGKLAPGGSPSNPRKYPVQVKTCEEFNKYIRDKGVVDENGKRWPNSCGVTTYKCDEYQQNYTWKATPNSSPGHFCIKLTSFDLRFPKWSTANGKVTVADWRPPTPQSTGCKLEEEWFREGVLIHEEWHIGDINKVIALANASLKRNPPNFGVTCEGTQQQALDALDAKISKIARSKCDWIERTIVRRARAYDRKNPCDLMGRRNCCSEGQTVCDGYCVDLLTDSTNCGQCGVECPIFPGPYECVNGKCDCRSDETKCGQLDPGAPYTGGIFCCPSTQPLCCGKHPSGGAWRCCRQDEVCCIDSDGEGWCGPPC
jgi:hypothetical protein